MGQTLTKLFTRVSPKKEVRIPMVGLDAAGFDDPMAHATREIPSVNFIWAQFRAATILMRSHILYIFHRGFIMTSNGKSVELSVPALLAFLQVKYQGIDKNPFLTHSKTMHMAIFSLLMYIFFAYGANLRFVMHDKPPSSSTYPFHCMVLFGNTAVASLASIFFPDSIRPVLYVLCVLISTGELLYWVYQREEHIFMRHIHRFFNALRRWLFNYFPTDQTDILPRSIINSLK
ncbi:Hypothetical predicted protein [Olea europaea subsp. europaea]|uniref:Uncharacterized protein n=1 Tax=Olea europaea subsp. europaea TaxID=158383 RepID=A0A8S0VBC3_OLEEU|nr:Hypothetical predicted protein [Olea europaea subsp. europaea]